MTIEEIVKLSITILFIISLPFQINFLKKLITMINDFEKEIKNIVNDDLKPLIFETSTITKELAEVTEKINSLVNGGEKKSETQKIYKALIPKYFNENFPAFKNFQNKTNTKIKEIGKTKAISFLKKIPEKLKK